MGHFVRVAWARYLTINSQPNINGVPSTHPEFGWGAADGYVYQKAYVEFFCTPAGFQRLLEILPGCEMYTYMAVNSDGEVMSNTHGNNDIFNRLVIDSYRYQVMSNTDGVNAVTWSADLF